ncbi:unnamed protein product [Gongylonema pulchrum]|uniref:Uncharacterized protein n=1 Tax=Gongylonema pulchrum TaxID=637853 RepID=A0A183EE42_9BILA|nr:unnamed protein product [Gongylonema pulchrum]
MLMKTKDEQRIFTNTSSHQLTFVDQLAAECIRCEKGEDRKKCYKIAEEIKKKADKEPRHVQNGLSKNQEKGMLRDEDDACSTAATAVHHSLVRYIWAVLVKSKSVAE